MIDNAGLESIYSKFIEDQTSERFGNRIPEYMVHPLKQNANFFFGTRVVELGDHQKRTAYIGKPQNRDGHVLVIGGAGSGKSSCIAIPTLATWSGTIFAIDIKGELSEHWNSYQINWERPKKIFKFSKWIGDGSNYDPFYFLRESDENDLVQNAREIAQAIIPIPPNIQEPFWSQAAQHVLTAVILYVCGSREVNEDTGEVIEGTFNHAMTLIQSKPIWELIAEIAESKNKAAIMHINQFIGIENPEDNKMLAGISAELSNRVMVFATDNRIRTAFTKSDDMLRWEDLESKSVFMRIPEDKLGQWDGAITLMLTQLI